MEAIKTLAIIGVGNMAEALLKGWLSAGLITAGNTRAVELVPQRRDYIKQAYGIQVTNELTSAVAGADVVLIAVKPQQIASIVPDLAQSLTPGALVISIVTGITLTHWARALGEKTAIVRVMPNTPCLVGTSASGLCVGKWVSPAQKEVALQLLQSVGKAFLLPESQLDAVTGLSGSGPAYVCLVIEALAAGGVYEGLSQDVALALAAQTVLGTATMILQSGEHPAVLRDKVTSAGGTTARGLYALEQAGVRAALSTAVQAAAARARELGED